jgi:hypothetical protein
MLLEEWHEWEAMLARYYGDDPAEYTLDQFEHRRHCLGLLERRMSPGNREEALQEQALESMRDAKAAKLVQERTVHEQNGRRWSELRVARHDQIDRA